MSTLKKLIREIHERSVWQVLTVYLVGSWAALQAVDTLVGVVGLPAWFPGLALALVILGLPMVLATAVVQEGVGPRRTSRPPAERAPDHGDTVPPPDRPLSDGEPGADGNRVRAHHVFTWRNAAIGVLAAFALWGVVAAVYVVAVGPGRLQGARAGVGGEVAAGAADTAGTARFGVLSVETRPRPAEVVVYRVRDGGVDTDAGVRLGPTPITDTVAAGEYLVRLAPTTGEALTLLARVPDGGTTAVDRTLPPDSGWGRGMVAVPTGSLADELSGGPSAEPVEAFLIDRYEVTNAEFAAFIADGGYDSASYWPTVMEIDGEELPRGEGLARLTDQTGSPGPRGWSGGVYPEGRGRHPVTGVTWYEARAYARWAGKRLPTWGQWWRAALGEGDRRFPWGDDEDTARDRARFASESTAEVGTHPLGVSPFGAHDLAGNVREWLQDPPPDAPHRRLAVGGAWRDPPYTFDPTLVQPFPPGFSSEAIGFRCVRRAPSEETQGGSP